jgi:hypothetical protein
MLTKMKAKTNATLKEVQATKEETIAEMKVWHKEIKSCKESGRTEINPGQEDVMVMNLEAIPEDVEAVAERQEIPTEEAAVKTVSTEEVVSSCWAPPTAEEMNPGLWWIPEEVARHLQTDDPRDTVIRDQAGTVLQEKPLRKGHFRGDNGRPRKQEGIQELHADSRAGDGKANHQDFHQTAENVSLDIVEGSASSKMIEGAAHRVRAIDVGALTTPRILPHRWKRWMMVVHLDRLAPYQGPAWGERP